MELVKKFPRTTCSKFLTKVCMTDTRERKKMQFQYFIYIFPFIFILTMQGLCCYHCSHLTDEAQPDGIRFCNQ